MSKEMVSFKGIKKTAERFYNGVILSYNKVLVLAYAVAIIMSMGGLGKVFAATDPGYDESPVTLDQNLWGQALAMVNDTLGSILLLSTGIAGIGVATGVFMKKLSMGNQHRIETGNKVIRDSIIGWATVNSLSFILGYISKYTSGA